MNLTHKFMVIVVFYRFLSKPTYGIVGECWLYIPIKQSTILYSGLVPYPHDMILDFELQS